jgi:hypothetical protein
MATRVSVRWRRCRVSVRACCNSYRWCWCGRCSHPPQSKTHMKMTAPSDERDKQRPSRASLGGRSSRFGSPPSLSPHPGQVGVHTTERFIVTSREEMMTSTASRRHWSPGGRGVSMPYLQVPLSFVITPCFPPSATDPCVCPGAHAGGRHDHGESIHRLLFHAEPPCWTLSAATGLTTARPWLCSVRCSAHWTIQEKRSLLRSVLREHASWRNSFEREHIDPNPCSA